MEENDKVKMEVNANNDVSGGNVNKISKARNKNLTIVLVVIIILLILAIGVCAGLWFAGNTTKIINKTEENQEQIKEDENTRKEEEEIKTGNTVFDNITDKNFKEIEILFLQSDYSYHTLNTKDYILAEKIINIAKTLELEEKEYKSFHEMNSIVIEYGNENVVLRYDNSENRIFIIIGSGDTFKVWENDNIDKINEIKKIVNEYKKDNPDKVEKEVVNNSQEVDNSNGLYDNLYDQEMFECEYFKMVLPTSWAGKYRVEYEEYGNRKVYMFAENEHMEILFNIIITDGKLEGESPYSTLYDTNGTTEYYFTTRGDGPVYLEPITSMLGDFSGIENNLYIKKTLTNEYGDATKTINVYGRQFISIAGATGRGNIYYINQNSMLCKTNLVDLSTEILASSVKDIQIDQNNIIHAYPLGDSFMNNIAMEDDFVVFENIN